jgi:hypothetical protein
MLDGKAEVKAEFIAERQFTPQLLVPLVQPCLNSVAYAMRTEK